VTSGGSPDLTFVLESQPQPVLEPGKDWDSQDVLNPSVVRLPLAATDSRPSLFNFYSGYDGSTWRTGLATSADGTAWQKMGAVFGPDRNGWEGSYIAANGAALSEANTFWYWYQAGPRGQQEIGLARSRDGVKWSKEPAPVLTRGPYASWDERTVADPYAIRAGGWFYLYYLGQDRGARQRRGVAFDEAGLGEPAVWNSHGYYWMLYTGRDTAEHRRMGLARSTDGVHWRKLPAVFSGQESWNSKVVCDATVLVEGETVRVWFGGGDVASPDENLHGRIGYASLRPTDGTLTK
jgi:predicted GH43/DUF377 family glycosyl hydrolase